MKKITLITASDLAMVLNCTVIDVERLLEEAKSVVYTVDDVTLILEKQAFDITYLMGKYECFTALTDYFRDEAPALVENVQQGRVELTMPELCRYINDNTTHHRKLTPKVMKRWLINRRYLQKRRPEKCPTHMIEGNRNHWFTKDYRVLEKGAIVFLKRVIEDNASGYMKQFF